MSSKIIKGHSQFDWFTSIDLYSKIIYVPGTYMILKHSFYSRLDNYAKKLLKMQKVA